MNELLNILFQYRALQLEKVFDFSRFNEYAITHHSTVIEGSTLTENETRLLLDEGITPAGKPLMHTLMVTDHFKALQFVLESARASKSLTVQFVKDINAHVMANTGALINAPLGTIDASKGEYRKGNVRAGNSYFIGFDKVENAVKALVENLNKNLSGVESDWDKLNLSFAAHFDLVCIHPWYDGNGRTSRLLMNYIQQSFNLPLAIVYKEDKAKYYTALDETRSQKDMAPFNNFMYEQYIKMMKTEIINYKNSQEEKPGSSKGLQFSVFF